MKKITKNEIKMPIYYMPITIDKQIEAIQALVKINFLSYEEKLELKRIEEKLKFRMQLDSSEKEFFGIMISKYGYMVK